jgi:uncharacterized protein with PIN domain
MKQADIRFYAELNDFLPLGKRNRRTAYEFEVSGAVKDVIEALGVPHTEVDLMLANGESVDFSYRVRDGDRISVYPVFESIDISPLERLHPRPLRNVRFAADTHLGRLAKYLRMAGFDTAYRREHDDEELAKLSLAENRVLLTRDRGLLKRNTINRGYYVRATNPREQLVEVLARFDLLGAMAPFERCVHCNTLLEQTQKELISDRLLPDTQQYYDEFCVCPACDRIYWKGSHYRRMQQFMQSMAERGCVR